MIGRLEGAGVANCPCPGQKKWFSLRPGLCYIELEEELSALKDFKMVVPDGRVREFSSSPHSENLVGILKVKLKKVDGVTKTAVPLSFKLSSYSTSVSVYWSGLPCPPLLSLVVG